MLSTYQNSTLLQYIKYEDSSMIEDVRDRMCLYPINLCWSKS